MHRIPKGSLRLTMMLGFSACLAMADTGLAPQILTPGAEATRLGVTEYRVIPHEGGRLITLIGERDQTVGTVHITEGLDWSRVIEYMNETHDTSLTIIMTQEAMRVHDHASNRSFLARYDRQARRVEADVETFVVDEILDEHEDALHLIAAVMMDLSPTQHSLRLDGESASVPLAGDPCGKVSCAATGLSPALSETICCKRSKKAANECCADYSECDKCCEGGETTCDSACARGKLICWCSSSGGLCKYSLSDQDSFVSPSLSGGFDP